jgi:hypothetical protein
LLPFLELESGRQHGQAVIIEADARSPQDFIGKLGRLADAVVTSPPYATALPYIDTDRLSLSYLGLLSRSCHRQREAYMIGNREITDRVRKEYEDHYKECRQSFPARITSLVDRIAELNRDADVGFRRRNLPSLLFKYFLDMRTVFAGMWDITRPGAWLFIVVGNNHTIAGAERVEIPTDQLLGELGEQVGLTLERIVSMEMLVSRDIFRRNASNAESILCFRRP